MLTSNIHEQCLINSSNHYKTKVLIITSDNSILNALEFKSKHLEINNTNNKDVKTLAFDLNSNFDKNIMELALSSGSSRS
ncbi:unnamed protein product, partial [Didymodactylos carnosus]